MNSIFELQKLCIGLRHLLPSIFLTSVGLFTVLPAPAGSGAKALSQAPAMPSGRTSHVAPDDSQCRIWIYAPLLSERPQLESQLTSKGYKVQRLTTAPNIKSMNRIYDIALYPTPDRQIHAYLTFNPRVLAEMGPIYYQPEQLPACRQLPDFADEAYYRAYFGRLARERLNAFYKSGKLQPGIGSLFLQSESLRIYGFAQFQPRFEKLLKEYQTLVTQVQNTWDATAAEPDLFKRLDPVRALLLPFYENYLDQQPLLTLGLQNPSAGNCQVSTQLLLFTMIDAGLQLGPDWQLGAQLFLDHIQPVIYNLKEARLVELVSGKRAKFDAPVYSPELLTYALGRAAGTVIPSERETQLVLRNADFLKVSKRAWSSYWIFDQRASAYKPWRMPSYLQFDPAFSEFSEKPPKNSAKIEYQPITEEDPVETPTETSGAGFDAVKILEEMLKYFPAETLIPEDSPRSEEIAAKLKEFRQQTEKQAKILSGESGTASEGPPSTKSGPPTPDSAKSAKPSTPPGKNGKPSSGRPLNELNLEAVAKKLVASSNLPSGMTLETLTQLLADIAKQVPSLSKLNESARQELADKLTAQGKLPSALSKKALTEMFAQIASLETNPTDSAKSSGQKLANQVPWSEQILKSVTQLFGSSETDIGGGRGDEDLDATSSTDGDGNIGNSVFGNSARLPEEAMAFAIEKYWQNIPENARPSLKAMRKEMLAETQVEVSTGTFIIRSKIYIYPATIEDLERFKSDLQILIEPLPDDKGSVTTTIGGATIRFDNIAWKVGVRSARLMNDIRNAKSLSERIDVIRTYIDSAILEKFKKLNHAVSVATYAYLRGEGPAPQLPDLRTALGTYRAFTTTVALRTPRTPIYGIMAVFDEASKKIFCDYRKSLKRNVVLSPAQMDQTLQRLKQLDPTTHRAFFGFLSLMEKNEVAVNELSGCDINGSESLPDQILGKLVIDSLTKSDQQMLKPVTVIFPKLFLSEAKKDEVPDASAEDELSRKLNTQKAKEKFLEDLKLSKSNELHPETLLGLLFSAQPDILMNPALQQVALRWLTPLNLESLKTNWGSDPVSVQTLYDLVDQTVLIQEMPAISTELQTVIEELKSRAVGYFLYVKPEAGCVPISKELMDFFRNNPRAKQGSYKILRQPIVRSIPISEVPKVNDPDRYCQFDSSTIIEVTKGMSAEFILSRDRIGFMFRKMGSCPEAGRASDENTKWTFEAYRVSKNSQNLITKSYGFMKSAKDLAIQHSTEVMNAAQVRAMVQQNQAYDEEQAQKKRNEGNKK